MLPRPQGQVDILRHLARGRAFVADIVERRGKLLEAGTGSSPAPLAGSAGGGSSIHLVR
jgi:hypothetical protein